MAYRLSNWHTRRKLVNRWRAWQTVKPAGRQIFPAILTIVTAVALGGCVAYPAYYDDYAAYPAYPAYPVYAGPPYYYGYPYPYYGAWPVYGGLSFTYIHHGGGWHGHNGHGGWGGAHGGGHWH